MTATDATDVNVTKVREELHRLIDQLPAWDAVDALEHVRSLLSDEETLTEEEMAEVLAAEEAMARGEYVTFEELKTHLSAGRTRSASTGRQAPTSVGSIPKPNGASWKRWRLSPPSRTDRGAKR